MYRFQYYIKMLNISVRSTSVIYLNYLLNVNFFFLVSTHIEIYCSLSFIKTFNIDYNFKYLCTQILI